MHNFFFIFLLFSSLLCADTAAVTENDPNAIVEGVSVITGDLYVLEDDVVIQGVQPICLSRSYVSQKGLGYWDFLSYHVIFTVDNFIEVTEPSGATLLYEKTSLDDQLVCTLKNSDLKGITNTARGSLSGKHNLKNQRLEFTKKKYGSLITVVCSDGTKRIYENSDRFGHPTFFDRKSKIFSKNIQNIGHYYLVKEEFPNGNKIIYEWPKKKEDTWMIKSCNQDETIIYAWAKFYPKKGKYSQKDRSHGDYGIETSDGRHVEHYYFSHNNIHQLKKVESSERPIENMEYLPYGDRRKLLKSLSWPHGRYREITYYMPDDSYYNTKIQKNDELCFRVKEILSPIKEGGGRAVTHTFRYDLPNKKTTVIDAEGNSTVYYWNDDLRLTKIDRCIGGNVLYNRVKFIWGEKGSQDETNLLCKILFDEKKQPIWATCFFYDEFGNVKEEKFYGNLTGKGGALLLNSQGFPEDTNLEVYSKRSQYSLDGQHLLYTKEEDNGLKVKYSYLKNTPLPEVEEYYDHKTLCKRIVYTYDGQKNLIQEAVEDLLGSTNLTTRYTLKNAKETYACMPETIEEFAGDDLLRKTFLHYTAGGRICRKDIFDSLWIHRYSEEFHYENGLLKKEINALNHVAETRYDDLRNKISYVDFGKRSEVTFDYDLCNRLKWVLESGEGQTLHEHYKYNCLNQKVEFKDEYQNVTLYKYDPFNNLLETHLPGSKVILSTYDAQGCETSHIDAMGYTTHTSYNAYKKPIHITYPDGTQEFFCYYKDGTLKTHINQKGIETTYSYDAFGRVTSRKTPKTIETFTYDSFNLTSETNAEGITTFYEYDKAGRKILEKVADEVLAYEYDPLGCLYKKTFGDLVFVYIYNNLAQVIEEREEDLVGNWLEKISYDYDAKGNLVETTKYIQGKESKEILTYDPFCRLVKKTDALGFKTHYIHETSPHRITTTDPLGLQTIQVFNAQNKLDTLEKKTAKGETLFFESYYYDLNNNLEKKETIFDSQTQVTFKEYDSMNRTRTLIEGFGSSDQKKSYYTYTPTGLLETVTKPSGTILTYDYDQDDNLKSQRSSDGTINYSYKYNLMGDLLESQDKNTKDKVTRTYDFKGNLKTETYPTGFIVTSDYDKQNRKTLLSLWDHSHILYEYNALHLKKVSRYKKDTFLYAHQYIAHDLAGHVTLEEKPLGLGYESKDYDVLGRLIFVSHPYFQQKALDFDPVGNLLATNRQGELLRYTYDSLYQLTSEKDHTYLFDALHNRKKKDSTSFSINALNQSSELEYNLDGNPKFLKGKKLSYDALDRLISIEGENTSITYSYDAFHRRLSKKIYENQILTKELYYLYDGQNEIGSYDATGTILELRVLGNTFNAEISSSVAIEMHGKVHIPFHDLQGNASALYSLDGTLERYSYTAFGEEKFSFSCNPWRFSSKRTDEETGLVYYGRRYYCPEMGRWLTPDPLGLEAGPNLYAFLLNAPLTHFDLYGLIELEDVKQGSIGTIHGTLGFGTNLAIEVASLAYVCTGLPAHYAFKAMGADEAAHYCSPSEFHKSNTALRENMQDLIQKLVPADTNNSVYQKSSFYTEMVENAALIATAVGGVVKLGVKAISSGVSKVSSKLGFMSSQVEQRSSVELVQRLSSVERNGVFPAGSRRSPLEYASFQAVRNEAVVINNKTYVGHALDRMQDRGFMPSIIENAIKTGNISPTKIPGRFEYYDSINNLRVIVQDNERIISVIPKRSGK